MEADNIQKLSIVLAAIAVTLSAATLYVMIDGGDEGGSKFTLYIGLPYESTQEDLDSAEQVVRDTIAGDGSGYTMYWAEGGTASDGEVLTERTLVVVILFSDRSTVDGFAERIKAETSASILIEEQKAKAWFCA